MLLSGIGEKKRWRMLELLITRYEIGNKNDIATSSCSLVCLLRTISDGARH